MIGEKAEDEVSELAVRSNPDSIVIWIVSYSGWRASSESSGFRESGQPHCWGEGTTGHLLLRIFSNYVSLMMIVSILTFEAGRVMAARYSISVGTARRKKNGIP